jgi:hypothetical protein
MFTVPISLTLPLSLVLPLPITLTLLSIPPTEEGTEYAGRTGGDFDMDGGLEKQSGGVKRFGLSIYRVRALPGQ